MKQILQNTQGMQKVETEYHRQNCKASSLLHIGNQEDKEGMEACYSIIKEVEGNRLKWCPSCLTVV